MRKIFTLFIAAMCCFAMRMKASGDLPGAFTINANNDRVQFSKGNLQYKAIGNMWKFADNQYDIIGADNSNIDPTYNGWIDLFGWSTVNNPTNASYNNEDYPSVFVEWGSNTMGGNWRTLTADEWAYLIGDRYHADELIALGKVENIKGLILLPDQWTTPDGLTFVSLYEIKSAGKRIWSPTTSGCSNCYSHHFSAYSCSSEDDYTRNHYTVEEWNRMEDAGAVFLPAAGCRFDKNGNYTSNKPIVNVSGAGYDGEYWTSDFSEEDGPYKLAFYLDFSKYRIEISDHPVWSGKSVRLIQEYSGSVPVQQFTVTFLDWDGSVIEEQPVDVFQAANAPTPSRQGYVFIGWNNDFSRVEADITAVALYSKNNTPEDKILTGAFSINEDGDQITFAQGNLQYNESKDSWRFAENQWDQLLMSSIDERSGDFNRPDRWRDLIEFTEYNNYPIENRGDYDNWRILALEEWRFLLFERFNADKLRGAATVNNRKGFILLPDEWKCPEDIEFTAQGSSDVNQYNLEQWELMEDSGAVFLPFTSVYTKRYEEYSEYPVTDIYYSASGGNTSADYGIYWTDSTRNFYQYAFMFKSMGSCTNSNGYEAHDSLSYYGCQPLFCEGSEDSPHPYWGLTTRPYYYCSMRLVRPYENLVPEPEPEPKTLTGRFSVSADKQVIFSQGNLQYRAKTDTWKLADNQYDMIGYANANISASCSKWIDLFGWGTGNNPVETSKESAPYASYSDWTANPIVNGNNETWYTLSAGEWTYLLSTRTDAANLKGQAVVNDIKGYILLPDDWTLPANLTFTLAPNDYTTNIYTLDQWTQMEAAGAVFLPAAGDRYGTDINSIKAGNGYYWTPTPSPEYSDMAQAVTFTAYTPARVSDAMVQMGYAVRPAREVKASEGMEQIPVPQDNARKYMINGQIYIALPDGKVFDVRGLRVR